MRSLRFLFVMMLLAASPFVARTSADGKPAKATKASAAKASPAKAAAAKPAAQAEVAKMPPSEEAALPKLLESPRHGEYMDVKVAGMKVPVRTWVSYPERKDKAGVVIVIHEIFGLSPWIRSVADQLAADGFIAVAPDLISGLGNGGGGTDSVSSRDQVVSLVRSLTPERTTAMLDAVRAQATALPAANGKVATIGFCWGGARSFEYAANPKPPQAAVVYYGTSPDSATLVNVKAPVIGFYGGDDARVNMTIEPAKAVLAKLDRPYESNIFAGAGHGFLRQQTHRGESNLTASREAWPKTIAFLRQHLE